ncbi:RIP metalloprotease [Patescibacteria group bacterium]
MLTIIIFVAILSILVLVHELGHFISAKKVGIKVEEFGFGYPPRIWGKKIGETIYSINLLPFGGFVRLFGEELKGADLVNQKEKDKSFWGKSKKARILVIVAGVLANFLLAVVAFSIAYTIVGIPEETDRVEIIAVMPESPAEEAGLIEGDLMVEISGAKVESIDHFTQLIEEKKGQEVDLLVEREVQKLSFLVLVREFPPEGEGSMGVIVSGVQMIHYPVWQMPFRGAVEGFKEAFAWTGLILTGLGKMITDLFTKGVVPRDVAGPIGILQITYGVAQTGGLAILQFMGILSVNLVVLNILPLPALDGGRLMFVIYEVITRRRPRPEFEHWANAAGMAMIVLLLILVTVNDLVRIWNTTSLAHQLRTFWPF